MLATSSGSPIFFKFNPDLPIGASEYLLAKPGITTVFYMGLARVDRIAAQLVAHGAPAGRPAAIIAQGTLDDQRVISGTLGTIAAAAAASNVESPALLIVGEVVSLHDQLAWFNGAAQAGIQAIA